MYLHDHCILPYAIITVHQSPIISPFRGGLRLLHVHCIRPGMPKVWPNTVVH